MSQHFALHNPGDIGYDVWLLIGQSNEVGYGIGRDATYLDTVDPRVFQYPGSGTYVGQVVAGFDPLIHKEGAGAVGHAMTFARRYARGIPVNRRVLLVPCAYGGTGFTTSDAGSPPAGYYAHVGGSWDPADGSGGTSLYDFAIAQANAAIALDPNNRLAGIIWHQGEADRTTLTQSQYAAKLDALIDGLRSNITGASAGTPFILGQMLPELIATDSNAQNINAAHVDTPYRKTRVGFFYGPSGQSNGDGLHYNAAGQRTMGRSAYDALLRARVNTTGQGPVAPTGLMLIQLGTTVVASWAQPLCRVTDYKIEYSTDGGSTWAILTRSRSIDVAASITVLTLGSTVKVRVSTVNESATSAASSVAMLTLVTAPNAVTSLAAGTASSVSVPLTWTAAAVDGSHAAASSYLVEYKLHASGTWSAGPTVTGTAATVSGLADTTQYDFRVTAQNAAGSGSASSTISGTTAAPTPLLGDVGVSAFRAHGLRKLNSSYAGSAIKVRRSSDNTTQNIGFAANGDLDATGLLAFVGSSSGYIDTWYDQSGNSRHIQQTTTTSQARIVNAGTLDTQNTRPAAVFDGASTVYQDSTNVGIYAAGASTTLAVSQAPSTIAAFAILVCEAKASGSGYYSILGASGAPPGGRSAIQDQSAATMASIGGGTVFANAALGQSTVLDTGSALTLYENAASIASSAYARSGHTLSPDRFTIGGLSSGGFRYTGSLAELLIFTSVLNTAQQLAGQANQKNYFGTP